MNYIKKLMGGAVYICLLVGFLIALLMQAYTESLSWEFLCYGGIISGILMFLFGRLYKWFKEKARVDISEISFIILLISIVVLPRYILNVNFQILQESDYEKYFHLSQSIFHGMPFPEDELHYIRTLATNQFIIEKIFSFSYNIWGTDGAYALLYMNICFSLGYTLLFYMICKTMTNKHIAMISAVILAVWPENIIISVYALSEPMHMFFLFLGIWLFIYSVKKNKWSVAFLAGGILRLSQEIRSVTLIFLITLLIIYLLFTEDAQKWKKGSILILGYWGFGVLYGQYLYRQIGEISSPAIGWPIYLGSCIENWGSWGISAASVAQETAENFPISEVQGVLLQKAIRNYQGYDLKTIFWLVMKKLQTVFGLADATTRDIKYLMINRPEVFVSGNIPSIIWAWCNMTNWIYVNMVLFTLGFIIFKFYNLLRKGTIDKIICVFALPICGIMAMHCIIYVSPRYIYPVIPCLIVIFVYGIDNWREGCSKWKYKKI